MSDSRPAIRISINGEDRALAAGSTVADLLAEMGLGGRQVAVERNREVVRRGDHAATELLAGDRIEVVTFFGGG